jgi:hypothetical protein
MDLTTFEKIVNDYLVNTTDTKTIFSYLRSILNPILINVSYNVDGEYVKFILSVSHSAANYNIPMVALSNGLIFTIKDKKCKILAVPLKSCATLMNLDNIRRSVANYKIYPLLDGTSVVLYYDDTYKKWMYGSRKSMDIYNNVWREVQYGDVIDKLLGFDFNYKALNENYCYHLLFKHPDMHPYNNMSNYIYHQSTVDRTTMEYINTNINLQQIKPMPAESIKDESGMGFIFRLSTMESSPMGQDYKYETPLRRRIVKYVYQTPYIKNNEARKTFENYFSKKNFFVVNNFMNVARQSDFLTLFPQYGAMYDDLQSVIDNTINLFMNKESTDPRADKFYAIIKSRILDEYDPQNTDVLRQLIMNVKYATLLYDSL